MAGAVDVVVRFVGDSSKLRDETAKVQGTGAKLKTWAKGVGVAIGAAFAVDQLKDWIGAASKLQDAVAATQQIFGPAARTVQDFAKGAADSFGLSQQAALDAADTFATFGKGAGLTGRDLSGFSTKLVGLAGDLASFRGTSPEQAVEAIGAALRGETEPIRAYGVLLDDATLRQQALKMGLIKTTKEALTPQQKVLAAQAQLFAQTKDAQGDFARTGDSAANQQKKLAANLENTQAALGTALLPVLTAILPILSELARIIQENSSWLIPLAAGILAVVAAQWLWNAAVAANPLTLIVIAIAAVIAGVILLVKNWDKVTAAFAWTWNWLKQNWPLLLPILLGPFGAVVLLIMRNWGTIKAGAAAVISWFRSTWATLSGIISAPFKAAWSAISGVISSIRGAISSAWSFISDVVGRITGAVSGVLDKARDIAGRIGSALKGPINAVIRAWNRLEFKVPEVKVGPISFGGQTIGLPNVPELARGGAVVRTGLAVVHEGETYSGVGGQLGGSSSTFNINVSVATGTDPARVGRELVNYIVAFERANGNRWRTA